MCVIFIADKVRPTEDMVERAFEKNKEGAGIAWREKDQVRWAKGLDLEQVWSLIQKVPFPFISHFRIETTGGVRSELTHPFLVDPESSLALHGKTKGAVMFHNGTWHPWKDRLLETAVRSGVKLPGGRWSDSRAMAFCASIYGTGFLDLIDEKSVILSPTELMLFGNGWTRVNDIAVSNRLWEHTHVPTRVSGATNTGTKASETETKSDGKPTGGASPEASFRNDGSSAQSGKDKPEGPKASKKEVRSGHAGIEETSTPLIKSEEDAVKAIEWVRSKNPSEYRRPLPAVHDDAERDRRAANSRLGIVHLGPL